jgi:alpha-L-fucosidase 2
MLVSRSLCYFFDKTHRTHSRRWRAVVRAALAVSAAIAVLVPVPVLAIPARVRSKTLKDLVYASPGGVPLRLDAYLVRGDAPSPAVIYVHGGGWSYGDKQGGFGQFLTQLLLNQGYSVFSINYRLAPKYPYPAAAQDVRSALAFVRANARSFRILPNRIALAGSSAGGHLAALVGTTACDGPRRTSTDCPIRTIVDFYGPADLRGMTSVAQVRAFLGPRFARGDGRVAVEASPITRISRNDPSFLILHGDRDPIVPYAQSVQFYRALQQGGVPSRLITVTGGNHGTNWDAITAVNWQREIVRWLRTYL